VRGSLDPNDAELPSERKPALDPRHESPVFTLETYTLFTSSMQWQPAWSSTGTENSAALMVASPRSSDTEIFSSPKGQPNRR
jgi:hypothetical protein